MMLLLMMSLISSQIQVTFTPFDQRVSKTSVIVRLIEEQSSSACSPCSF